MNKEINELSLRKDKPVEEKIKDLEALKSLNRLGQILDRAKKRK